MDFEKVFEDENRYRDKFNERLENYLDILNEFQKNLDAKYTDQEEE